MPASAVPLFLDALAAEGLSVAAFEESAAGEGSPWRIEILHAGRPDKQLLARRLAPIAEQGGVTRLDLRLAALPETDWLARTAEQFPPQRVGRFWIHGSHVGGPPPRGAVPILIDAGLAFGSGEHATTRGCLLVLDRLGSRRRPRRVLDLGCGSGILAIAAAKLGARRVLAADNDPAAVAVAAENAAQNGVAHWVACVESEGVASPRLRAAGSYDLILANILAGPLSVLARGLARQLAPGGLIVLSGLLRQQARPLLAAYRVHRLRPVARLTDGPWATLVLARGQRRGRGLLGRGAAGRVGGLAGEDSGR